MAHGADDVKPRVDAGDRADVAPGTNASTGPSWPRDSAQAASTVALLPFYAGLVPAL